MTEADNQRDIAVLKEQINGLREHQAEIRETLSNIKIDIKTLTASLNMGKGAYAALLLFVRIIGSGVMAIIIFYIMLKFTGKNQ